MSEEFKMKTLKLDATYRPIGVVDCLEALVMCIVGKATAVEEYEEEISSPSITFKIPSVIVLKTVVKFISTGIRPSRNNILWRDKNQCQYCGVIESPRDMTIDHVVPRSRGGENTWSNLVTCCKKCNQKKGNRTPEEANMSLLNKPVKPRNSILRQISDVQPIWNIYLW
jgi:5-methylcytosine-specific restriction endonuclease McrA